MVTAVRFGPDAMDVRTNRGYARYSYRHLRRVTVRGQPVVMFSTGLTLLGLPRELFPDWSLELITAVARGKPAPTRPEVTPLPPLPAPDRPTATIVADADTAKLLARSYARGAIRPWLRIQVFIGGLLVCLLLLTRDLKVLEITLTATALILGTATMMVLRAWRLALRNFSATMAPGYRLAASYGPGEVEFHTAAGSSRTPYSWLREVRIRGPVAVVTIYRSSRVPSQLLPPPAVAHMVARNPRITVAR